MRAIGLAVALASMAAACGTRLPDEAFAGAGQAATGADVEGVQEATGGRTNTGGGAVTSTTRPGGQAVGGTGGGGGEQAAGGGDGSTSSGGGGTDPGAVAAGSNQASDVGVTETTIRIGTIVAENGVLGDVFAAAASGLRSWVEWVNANGGIGGRTVELFTCDDREDRARALECARRLIENDQVFALLATNTRSLGGAAPYIDDQGVPVLGIPINNSFYRYPHFFSVYGSPYVRDGNTVAHDGNLASYSTIYRWFRENLGTTKAAVFSYDIAESAQAGDFLEQGLELEGFEVNRYVVSFAAPSFDAAVAEMQRNGVNLVFDSMDTGANIRLCDAIGRRGLQLAGKVSTIPVMGETFGEKFNDACRNVAYVGGTSRPFTDTSHPLIAEFQSAMQRYQRGRELHQWALEAWIIGETFRDALEAMGPAPTRGGFEDFLMGLREYQAEGLLTSVQWVPNDPPFDAPRVRDCVGISRWDDGAGGWTMATSFPYCIDDAHQYFTPVAEQGN